MQISPIVSEFIANGGFPVKHLSYSAISQYLKNPRSFKMKYIEYQFDDETNPSFLIGQAIHKWLEIYFQHFIDTKGEYLDTEHVKSLSCTYLDRLILIQWAKWISKYIKKNGGSCEFPTFTNELTDEEIHEHVLSCEKALEEHLLDAVEWEDDESIKTRSEMAVAIRNSLIKWGKYTMEDLYDGVNNGLDNFFAANLERGNPLYTERSQTVIISDQNGDMLPIPLKVITDRIDEIGDGIVDIIDYKSCDKFTDQDDEKMSFELQGAANFFAVYALTGMRPRSMKYIEILKQKPWYFYPIDPERKLLKDDLIEIATWASIEIDKKDKVDEIKGKLIEAWILIQKAGVSVYEINFDERNDVLDFFLELYKQMISSVALAEIGWGIYLPNIFDVFDGLKSALDFKEMDATPREKVVLWNSQEPSKDDSNQKKPDTSNGSDEHDEYGDSF